MSVDETVKLLLVDDEERNLDALEAILAVSDYSFVRARSADEALLAVLNNEFAAIILDIKMPGTNGLELAQLIKARKRNQHVPILFLTAHTLDERDVLQAYGVGGVDYLSKPINPAILRSKVAVFADLCRTTRALEGAVEALHKEIGEREMVQEQLRLAKEELESRVLERTAELARANREVRDNEERLRLALAVAQVAAWEWDLKSGKMRWSANPEIVFGFPAGAFGPDSRISHAAHAEDIALLDAALQRAVTSGDFEVEYRAVRPDGTIAWIADRGRIVQEPGGRASRIVGVSVDLTTRKAAEKALRDSEARLSAILQNTSALVCLMDADNRFVHLNRRFEELLGKSNDEVRGRSIYDVLPHDTAATFDANNRRVLAEGVAVEFEELIADRDGPRIYTSVKAPLFDSSGKPHSIVGVSTDITERKRLEDALREADRRKDEFLATLAHELRNPIAPIRYAVQVLNLKGPTSPELRWAIEVIERQTQHMARLIDDLLDVNRITRNSLELRKERIELATVINEATETTRPLIERSGHELALDLPSKPIYVDADAMRLAQVFSNLLSNAAKYGKGTQDRGHISLSVEDAGDRVTVTVKDTGVGIAPSMLPRIFDMFTQVGRSIEQSEGGLGIGLSLAKRLLEMHGGTIEARSEGIGRGSEFIVTLPVSSTPSLRDAKFSAGSQGPAGVSRHRILIADDNPDVAEAFQVMLEMLGHEVQTAQDGLEALEKAELFQPNVMALDIGMPKLNGYDTARRIRQQSWSKNVVLIALTGWGNEKDKRRSEEAGFNFHLVKPVDPVALGQLLDSLDPSARVG